jgi:hypothetical protein
VLRALNEALSVVPGLEYVLKHRLKTSAGALLVSFKTNFEGNNLVSLFLHGFVCFSESF